MEGQDKEVDRMPAHWLPIQLKCALRFVIDHFTIMYLSIGLLFFVDMLLMQRGERKTIVDMFWATMTWGNADASMDMLVSLSRSGQSMLVVLLTFYWGHVPL